MTECARIADELRRAVSGAAWHGDSLSKILKGVTAARAAAHPIPSAHSIWELVLHLSAWEGVALRRMAGISTKLSDARNFPQVIDATESAWQQTLEQARAIHRDLVAAVEEFPERSLSKQVPGKKGAHYNFRYMFHGLTQHVAYHAGQIALLKKM